MATLDTQVLWPLLLLLHQVLPHNFRQHNLTCLETYPNASCVICLFFGCLCLCLPNLGLQSVYRLMYNAPHLSWPPHMLQHITLACAFHCQRHAQNRLLTLQMTMTMVTADTTTMTTGVATTVTARATTTTVAPLHQLPQQLPQAKHRWPNCVTKLGGNCVDHQEVAVRGNAGRRWLLHSLECQETACTSPASYICCALDPK